MMLKLKNKLKKNVYLLKLVRWMRKLLYPITLKLSGVNSNKPSGNILNNQYRGGIRVIISVTTFPKRIHFVHKSLQSIMNQTYRPDLIILWLSEDEFPNKEADLPGSLLDLTSYGLQIYWTNENIRSYKKLIPTLKMFPNDIIITADDDLYYPKDWLENLIESYKKYPEDIHCHLITRISYNQKDQTVKTVPRYEKYINQASYNNKILGGSGTLYPPNSLSKEVFDINKMMELAPTSDDLWFWGAALKKHKKIRWISNNMRKLYYVETSQETPTLTSINDQGERLFLKHIINVIDYYQISELL